MFLLQRAMRMTHVLPRGNAKTTLILMKTMLRQSVLEQHFTGMRQEWKYLILSIWHQQWSIYSTHSIH